jgi:hypothetical protein
VRIVVVLHGKLHSSKLNFKIKFNSIIKLTALSQLCSANHTVHGAGNPLINYISIHYYLGAEGGGGHSYLYLSTHACSSDFKALVSHMWGPLPRHTKIQQDPWLLAKNGVTKVLLCLIVHPE